MIFVCAFGGCMAIDMIAQAVDKSNPAISDLHWAGRYLLIGTLLLISITGTLKYYFDKQKDKVQHWSILLIMGVIFSMACGLTYLALTKY
jgi:hypothetical protein